MFVLAATNRPMDIDSAVRRRFSRRVLIDVPKLSDRVELLKISLKKVKHNLKNKEITNIAECLDGYSNSDISNIIKDAVMAPLREIRG